MSLGFYSSPIRISHAPVYTVLDAQAFAADSGITYFSTDSYRDESLPTNDCYSYSPNETTLTHVPSTKFSAQNSLIHKIYSISVFSTNQTAIKTPASIVLSRSQGLKNFPFRINVSFNTKTNKKITIKKLTLGDIEFDPQNIICNLDKKRENLQAIVNAQEIKSQDRSLLEANVLRTHLNMHLFDPTNGDEVLISKRVTVTASFANCFIPKTNEVAKKNPSKTHQPVEIEMDDASLNLENNTPYSFSKHHEQAEIMTNIPSVSHAAPIPIKRSDPNSRPTKKYKSSHQHEPVVLKRSEEPVVFTGNVENEDDLIRLLFGVDRTRQFGEQIQF